MTRRIFLYSLLAVLAHKVEPKKTKPNPPQPGPGTNTIS